MSLDSKTLDNLEELAYQIGTNPDDKDAENSYEPMIQEIDWFFRQMPELISRARRAEELERENESRYSDREAFLADANLMVQEKTRIMHEVQALTTRMPPAALKYMGYALIEAGRNPSTTPR